VNHGRGQLVRPGFFGNRPATAEIFRPGTLDRRPIDLALGTRVRVSQPSLTAASTYVRSTTVGAFVRPRVMIWPRSRQKLGYSSGIAQVRLEFSEVRSDTSYLPASVPLAWWVLFCQPILLLRPALGCLRWLRLSAMAADGFAFLPTMGALHEGNLSLNSPGSPWLAMRSA